MKKYNIYLLVLLLVFMVVGCKNNYDHPITQWVYNSNSPNYSSKDQEYSVITFNSNKEEFFWVFGNRYVEYEVYGKYKAVFIDSTLQYIELYQSPFCEFHDFVNPKITFSQIDGNCREDFTKEQRIQRPVLIGRVKPLDGEERTFIHDFRTQIKKDNFYN